MTRKDQLFVIVPCSEPEDTIPLLEALVNQTDLQGRPMTATAAPQIILVNPSAQGGSPAVLERFVATHPHSSIRCVTTPDQEIALARRRGFAEALTRLERVDGAGAMLLTLNSDCIVHQNWLYNMANELRTTDADACISRYYYDDECFSQRPNLRAVVKRIMHARHEMKRLFGGFPDGTGFAVWADKYMLSGGIDVFYQLSDGQFVAHPTDDWDFGIKLRACGGCITYAERASVLVAARRINRVLQEILTSRTTTESSGAAAGADPPAAHPAAAEEDVMRQEAENLWHFALKDLVHRYIIMPLFLTPELFRSLEVCAFLSDALADRLGARIEEVKAETRLRDFVLIHSYKTPCYRLYFEFYEAILERLGRVLHLAPLRPPPLPRSLELVRTNRAEHDWRRFVYYYCEDRESGEARRYFREQRGF